MMKLIVAAICIAFVASVPVNDVPAKVETTLPATEAAPAVAVAAPAVVEAPKTEVAPAAVAEAPKATEAVAVVEAKKDDAAPHVEEVLKQVVNLVQSMTGGLSEQDSKSLKDMMSMGADILSQAEKKAQEISSKIQDQNLLQADNMFGIKEDGSIDASQAVDQVTNLINVFVGPNTVNEDEKKMMKSMLTMITSIVNPPANSNGPALAPMAHEFENILRAMMPPQTKDGKHDDLLHPESLLDMFGGAEKSDFDFNALADVTNKFFESLDKMEAPKEVKA